MTTDPTRNCERLRTLFEGREALYVEKGALRVRVTGIRCDIAHGSIHAQVEELPTVGLERTVFHGLRGQGPGPVRLDIAAGYMTSFSERCWRMGYGGWTLYFAPDLVEGVVRLASTWPGSLDEAKRYESVLELLRGKPVERAEDVFPRRP